MTDTERADRANIRKETLSRLRGRRSCDFVTLQGLSAAVGATVGVIDGPVPRSVDALFPDEINRDHEGRLVDLCASRDVQVDRWRSLGPSFFMAGLAVMLANLLKFDRRVLLELAENLHAGSSCVEVIQQWLARSPSRPTRFLPLGLASQSRAT